MPPDREESACFPSTADSRGKEERVGKGKNRAGILGGGCPLPWIRADSRAGTVTVNGKTSIAQSWLLLEFLECIYLPSG